DARGARLELVGVAARGLRAIDVRRNGGARLLLDGAELAPRRRDLPDVLVTEREVQERAHARIEPVALFEERACLVVPVLRDEGLRAAEQILRIRDVVGTRWR